MESTDTPLAAAREVLAELIGYPTISSEGNLELIAHLTQRLGAIGAACRMTTNEDGTKANLFATIGPEVDGGIVLSGHTDVVPVEGQDWSSDPFVARDEEGLIYGRGACDMKGFLACVLALAPRFAEVELARPLHLAFTYDEEVGCLGARVMLEALVESGPKPAACIIGEPTEMKVITAHKGKLSTRCRVRGLEAHSSLAPKGVNAIDAAARVIARLAEMAERKAAEGPFDADYDVPHTTVHTGLIQGGTQLNIVPGGCSFEFEFRNLPEDDPEALLAEVKAYAHEEIEPAMKAIAPDAGFAWQEMSSFPGLETPPDAEVVALAKALSGGNTTAKVAFGTEAGLFHDSGIPAVVCGPGSIEQAHKPDEYVSLEQVALCEGFMARLIDRVAAA